MNKKSKSYFLHIADVHLTKEGTDAGLVDNKAGPKGYANPIRENIFEDTLKELATTLLNDDITLSGVLLTGDYCTGVDKSGMHKVKELLLRHLHELKVDASKIIVTLGNHDIKKGTNASTKERYEAFINTWATDSIIPFLDGQNLSQAQNYYKDNGIIIIPVNTANWCHTERDDLDKEFKETINNLIKETTNTELKETLQKNFDKILNLDAAGISDKQYEAVGNILGDPGHRDLLKVIILHHHLLPVSSRVELKTYEHIFNLGQLREFLQRYKVDIVIHGHKHTQALYEDHIDLSENEAAHKVCVISGNNLAPKNNASSIALITVSGQPYAPQCEVIPIPTARPEARMQIDYEKPPTSYLWDRPSDNGPLLISSNNIDELYARACSLFLSDSNLKNRLICTLDLSPERLQNDFEQKGLPFPKQYPKDSVIAESNDWLLMLVKWWQQKSSNMLERIPYIHGYRLKSFAGKLDQIQRIKDLLKENRNGTSRAIATLLDPIRDFDDTRAGTKIEFAAFCLVQFSLREANNTIYLDATAYYRAQEIKYWWPINIAELCYMMGEIVEELKRGTCAPCIGQITTIAAEPRYQQKPALTNVAVPMLDRWVDTNPARLALIATELMSKKVERTSVIGHWHNAIKEIETSIESKSQDGTPLAIDGLKFIGNIIKLANEERVEDENKKRLENLAIELLQLAQTNERHLQDTKQMNGNYVAVNRAWQQNAARLIVKIKKHALYDEKYVKGVQP